MDSLKKEIEKCEVRCANCHWRRHYVVRSGVREAIAAAVEAHGQGKIMPSEMPIEKQADPKSVRSAPSFATSTGSVDVAQIPHAYTLPVLARFLGFVKAASQIPTNSFIAAFGAEELIADGVLKEPQIRGLSAEKLGELVIALRKQRDAARVETARLAAEAVKRAAEEKARAEELARLKAAAEVRRLAAVEAHGAGKILAAEMPFHDGERQRTDIIRVAPTYLTLKASGTESVPLPPTAYTVDGLPFRKYYRPGNTS